MFRRRRFLSPAIAIFFSLLVTSASFGLDRSTLLFYSSLDGQVEADFARGEKKALPGYSPAFIDGVRGKAAVVSCDSGLIQTLAKPISFWLDIDIPVDYADESIGALRYAQPGNLRWKEGSLSFWVKALDWHSGDGRNHYLAHFNMEDTLSFVWAPYPAWIEYRQSRISDRDIYKKFVAYPGIVENSWRNITVSWRGKEQWLYIDGLLRAHDSEGVPGYVGGGEYIAFGDAQEFRSAFDELIVLAEALSQTEATALYYRARRQGGVLPLITIPEAAPPPKVSHPLGESKYPGALKLTGWTDAILGVANDDATQVLLTYDDNNLYVSFVFPIPPKYRVNPTEYVNTPVKMEAKGKDANLFADDYFEVKLSPAGTRDTYRFALNAAGARFDSKSGDVSWDGKWKYQTSTDDYFWKAELALPFSMFGREKPSVGETWLVNFRHQAVQVIEMDSIWAYIGPDAEPMGRLTFGGAVPAIQLEKVANPASGSLNIEASINAAGLKKPARWQFDTLISTTSVAELNPDDETLKEIAPKAPEGFKEKRELALAPGKIEFIKVEHNLAKPLAADLLIIVRDDTGKEILLHRLPFAFSLKTSMEAKMLPSMKKLLVALDCGSISLVEKGVSARIEIIDTEGKRVRTASVDRLERVKQVVEVDLAGLPVGKYEALAKIRSGEKPLPEMKKEFAIKPDPEWLGTKVGVSDKVMDPWTPLDADENSISCWGRKYSYSGSVLPAQIEILGKEILASPIVINIRENGKVVSASGTEIEWKNKKENRIEYVVSGSAGSFDVRTENWIEYDGLMWVKLIVSPKKKGARIEEMTLEVPYRKDIATHWYNGQYRPDSATGYVPKERYVCPPANFARFGTAERGLQWCWQDTYSWKLADKKSAMELIPEPDDYRVRLKFIDHEVSVGKPIAIEFGLQALPSRPQPKGYHGPYWGGHSKVKQEMKIKEIPIIDLWTHRWYLWNYPKLTQEQLENGRARYVRDWQQFKLIHCIYSNHITTSPMSPEYRYFYEEWRVVPSSKPNFKALDAMGIEKARKDHSGHICYGSESYTDFYTYYLQKALKYFHGENPAIPIGLYYDNSGAATCANRYHGHGVLVDGEWKPQLAILAWRRANERIRRIIKGITPNSWFTVHMSGRPTMAYWSFNDIMIPGEQYAAFFHLKKAQADAAGKPWPYDYTMMTQLDRVRAEYSSQGYGPAQVFLSEIWNFAKDRPAEEQAKARRHLFGLLFVNDVMSWGNDSAKLPVLEALWEHLGWDDRVEFIPYWRNQQYLNMDVYDENKIVASIFRRERKVCIFAFNNTDNKVLANFELKLEGLGIRGYENATLVEPIAKESFKLKGRRVSVPLPPRDFRILFLEQ